VPGTEGEAVLCFGWHGESPMDVIASVNGSSEIGQRRIRRVESARSVDTGAGMSGGGGEVGAADRRAITEIRERRPPEELVGEVGAAAAEVAADQIVVHPLQIVRTEDRASADQLAEAR